MARPSPPPESIDVELPDGSVVSVATVRSARARRMRISVAPHRPPRLTVPKGTSARQMRHMLNSNSAWLARQLKRVGTIERRPDALGLVRPGRVWHEGASIPVAAESAERSRARLVGRALHVAGPSHEARVAAVERWYRRQARQTLRAAVERRAVPLGVAPTAISVRDQRARWGSCSAGGRLSFNWRLILAPPAVLDYLVVHELSHMIQPNHSAAFWELVEGQMTDWKAHDAWLKRHGAELRAYQIILETLEAPRSPTPPTQAL